MHHAANMMAHTNGRIAQTSGKARVMPAMGTSSHLAKSETQSGNGGKSLAPKVPPTESIAHKSSILNPMTTNLCRALDLLAVVMDIFMQNTSQGSLCLIIIITLIDITCQVHLDKCCTDRGLISWDLAMILGHPISKSDARTSQLQQGHSQPINFCT